MRRVAVLGTGIMGAGMARSLLPAGLDAVARQFRKAAAGGHGEEDMAAVYRAFRA
jgi:3-hydroxyisobutyrate dehydrogenase-like beta-hydroxyacid dehydrogenase